MAELSPGDEQAFNDLVSRFGASAPEGRVVHVIDPERSMPTHREEHYAGPARVANERASQGWASWRRWIWIGTVLGAASGFTLAWHEHNEAEKTHERATIVAARLVLQDSEKMKALGICARDIMDARHHYTDLSPAATSGVAVTDYDAAALRAIEYEVPCTPADPLGALIVRAGSQELEMTKVKVLFPISR